MQFENLNCDYECSSECIMVVRLECEQLIALLFIWT